MSWYNPNLIDLIKDLIINLIANAIYDLFLRIFKRKRIGSLSIFSNLSIITGRISVIIPALNESFHVKHIVEDVEKTITPSNQYEIIVVDAGSADDTVEVARKTNAIVLCPNSRKSIRYGESCIYGLLNSTGEVAVIYDTILYPFTNLNQLIQEVLRKESDLVIGLQRKLPLKHLISLRLYLARLFYSLYLGLYDFKLDDVESSIFVISRRKLSGLDLKGKGRGSNFKVELLVKAKKEQWTIKRITCL